MYNLTDLCARVQQIARSIGAYQREERKRFNPASVESKGVANFVSYVDKESELRIVDALRQLLPEAGFITEEGSAGLNDEAAYWVVDPLDGTSNYIHNIAPYCVSIALRTREEILLGVVYEVCRDECFHAIRGGKAYLEEQPIGVSTTATVDRAFLALGMPYDADGYRNTYGRLIDALYGRSAGIRELGAAAVELCYVACGRLDGRIEAFLGPWDVAAGGLILQQAGGTITDFQGGETWQSGISHVATNGALQQQLLQLVEHP